MNYANGGWYNSPNGRNQQYWNGQWYDTPQQNGGSSGGGDYNALLGSLNNNTNAYYNQQQGFYQTDHDIKAKQYDTQNALALGNQDQGGRSSFLSSVLSPEQAKLGTYQYKYGLDQAHENNAFGLQSTAYGQNRQLALDKLKTDEQNALAGLGLAQGKTNQAALEDLNGRGLLYGQTPTGGLQPNAIAGTQGLAGVQTGLINQDFANQRNQITQPYGLNVQGINQGYNQNMGLLNESHGFAGKQNAFDAANNINNQNLNYTANIAGNNNTLEQFKAANNNAKQKELYGNEQNAKTQGAMLNGYALYH